MNVKAGSGLGAGVGAGVASGVGTGTAVSDFRTRRPDCATIPSVHIATNASARLTLRVFETCGARIFSFHSVETAGYVHLHGSKNFVRRGPGGFNDFAVAIDAGRSRAGKDPPLSRIGRS